MFEVKVTVEAPALTEAINNLAGAMAARHVDNVVTMPTVVQDEPAPAEDAQPAPVEDAQPALVENVQPAPDSEPAAEAKSYTVEEISDAGAALVDQGKMAQLCDLLARYGVQAITQLDPGTYPAFVADLKALGAKL